VRRTAAAIFIFLLFLPLAAPVVSAQTGYSLIYSTYAGGSGVDSCRDIAIDSSGNIYATGGTASSNFTTLNAFDSTHDTTDNGGTIRRHDVWAGKWNAAGVLQWRTLLGAVGYDRAYACEVVSSGAGQGVYVAGRAGNGFDAVTTTGVVQENFAGDDVTSPQYGDEDGFVAKFDLDGNPVAVTYFGDGGIGFIRDIAVDSAGNVYLIFAEADGSAGASIIHASIPSFDRTHNGGKDGIVAKLNTDLTQVLYSSYLGASGDECFTPSIRVNRQNEAYVFFESSSTSGLASSGAADTTHNGGSFDGAIAKVSADGQSVFITYAGGSDSDYFETHNGAFMPDDRPVLAFTSKSSNMPTTAGAYDETHNGNATNAAGGTGTNYVGDGWIGIFNADLTVLEYATFFGGSQGEGLQGVFADQTGIYISGGSYSDNLPMTANAAQATRAGSCDVWVAKLKSDLSGLIFSSYLGGSGIDEFRTCAISQGRFYAGGQAESGFDVTAGATQTTHGGGSIEDGAFSVFNVPVRAGQGSRNAASRTAASRSVTSGRSILL
jgi:hypothetical protein